jgi:hypothetical protein
MTYAECFVIGYLDAANLGKDCHWEAMDENPQAWENGYRAFGYFQDWLMWG